MKKLIIATLCSLSSLTLFAENAEMNLIRLAPNASEILLTFTKTLNIKDCNDYIPFYQVNKLTPLSDEVSFSSSDSFVVFLGFSRTEKACYNPEVKQVILKSSISLKSQNGFNKLIYPKDYKLSQKYFTTYNTQNSEVVLITNEKNKVAFFDKNSGNIASKEFDFINPCNKEKDIFYGINQNGKKAKYTLLKINGDVLVNEIFDSVGCIVPGVPSPPAGVNSSNFIVATKDGKNYKISKNGEYIK